MQAVTDLLTQKNAVIEDGKIYIVKFTADWCKPCKRIKHVCLEWQQALGDAVVFVEINIDDEIDIYSFFKRKRVIRGIPAILAWKTYDPENEFWPQDSVCSGSTADVIGFFGRVYQATLRDKGTDTI